MKAVVGLATSILASALLIACTAAPEPSPTPSGTPSASSSAWPVAHCRDLAIMVGAALQRVVDSYEQPTGPQSTASPVATSTPTPSADADADAIQDTLAEVREAVEKRYCEAAQMRDDVDASIDEVRAETPLAEAVRARLVAGLDGRIPEQLVRRALYPDDDLAEALAEAPSGSTLLLSEGTWDLTEPLVLLSGVMLEGKGIDETRLTSSADEAAILVATAETIGLSSMTVARDTSAPGSGLVAGGAATVILRDVEFSGGRPDETGGGAGVMLVGGDDDANRHTTFEATNVAFRDNGWAGLAVAGAHRVSVVNATFTDNGECGLCFLGESDGSVTDATFDGNGIGVAVAESARPTLLDATISGGEVGLQIDGSAAPIVEGARVSGAKRAAIIAGGTSTGAIAGATCTDVEFGIVVTDTAAPTLTDNDCALARGSVGSASPSPTPGG